MRLKRTGNDSSLRLWAVLAMSAVFIWAMPTSSPAASGPLGTDVSTNEYMIILSPGADGPELAAAFKSAGFAAPRGIDGLPPRSANWRTVNVASTDDETQAALLAIPGVVGVRSVYRASDIDYPILTNGQVIARFKPGTTQAQVQQVAAANGANIARQMSGLPQAYVFDVNETQQSAHACATAIASNANVRWAHPSMLFKLQTHQAAPIEDALYPWQWHLNNIGQLPDARPGADIEVEEAWNATLGTGAIVAVLDECLQRDHEDLASNYITGFDFVDQDDDPSPTYGPRGTCWWDDEDKVWYCGDDPIGEAHGTAVAGLIAASANTIGVRGVAPEAGLIGCKLGLGVRYSLDQDIADAFTFAEQNGAMVINNSWGAPGGALFPVVPSTWVMLPDVISEAIDEVATNGRGGKGVLVTFSAGNESIPIDYGNVYAAIPNVMAIGASLRDDTLTCYSNYGIEQSVVAPGGGVDGSRDMGWGFPSNFRSTCYEQDMVTTDNMETTGYLSSSLVGWPIRGYNPMMKFLSTVSYSYCPGTIPDPYTACRQLVPDNFALPEFDNQNYTRRFNGTSAACPVASGVAALVFSINTGYTAEQVRNIIEHTADKPSYINEAFDVVTGHSDRYGHGRVNARRAVQAALADTTWPSPVLDLSSVGTAALARMAWTNPINDVDKVLVVRGAMGKLDWAPTDGVSYTVGQQVAPGVVVVANSLIEMFEQADLPADQYAYGLFVRSLTGTYSWGRRASFTSEGAVTAPQASLSASPTTGRAPLNVHFAGGAIDPTGVKNLSYSWAFGDGTTAFGATADHTYLSAGNYLVQLLVTNTYGQSGEAVARVIVTSEYNIPPTATISADQNSGSTPLVVRFLANASDQDGTVVSYLWDFGDGSTAAGRQVEHTFINAGIYGVMLTATDNLGATATDAVLITAQASSTTAAQTVPEGILSGASCGSGVPLAAAGIAIGLLGLMGYRRR